MALKLRGSEREGVVRSVGSPPNGILALGHPGEGAGEPAWIIDPGWTPSGAKLELPEGASGVIADMSAHDEGASPQATVISIEELVDAISDELTAEAIWFYCRALPAVSAEANASAGYFEIIESDVRFARETRDALARRGYLNPGELPGGE